MKVLKGLEFFAGTQKITKEFNRLGGDCKSLDFVQLKNEREIDYLCDFLDFDYQAYKANEIDFLFFGFPCNTFSKASGGLHFEKECFKSIESVAAYLMLLKMYDIIKYFSNAVFYIENPSGALCSKKFFIEYAHSNNWFIYTLSQSSFGYPTQKKTNIVTNSKALFLFPVTHRLKGRYNKEKLDNFSLKKRQSYPSSLATFVIENFLNN